MYACVRKFNCSAGLCVAIKVHMAIMLVINYMLTRWDTALPYSPF